MLLKTYQEPAAFLQAARPFLEAQEVINCLLLGVTIRLHEHPEWTETAPYLAAIENEGQVELAAAITPPHNLLLAGTPQTGPVALGMLIESLRADGWPFPGVTAEKRLAHLFAQTWSETTGIPLKIRQRLRAYELRQVLPLSRPPSGALRAAIPNDLDTIEAWRSAFLREALHEEPGENIRDLALRSIQAGLTYVWDDRGPVSLALLTRPTPHGISIGGVYTPPEHRAHGYASACVAGLSQQQLDQGRSFTALFTDLDYPTSNSIYQKIGYRPVCDFTEYILRLEPD